MLSRLLLNLIYSFGSDDTDIFDVKDQLFRALPTGISDSIIEKILAFISIASWYTSCTLDRNCFRNPDDARGMGYGIDFSNNHFCIYVSVPPRHALFGKPHTAINMGAAYSGTSPRGWWAFGWNYGHRYRMTIDNLCRLIDAGDFDAIDRLEVCTHQSLDADVQLRFNQLKEAHLRITGSPYTAKPGSSQKNPRHRELRRQRAEKAGPFRLDDWSCSFY